MIIKEITIKGFRSFGNNTTILKFDFDIGKLILLSGKNGNGKTSILSSLDYVLYGKCRGRNKQKLALSSLPNRINREMLVTTKFIGNGTEVEIERGMNPGILKLRENGIDNDRAGKVNIDEKIEKYIDMDFETYKSFISMSINNFKNFTSLTNEEKQILLDKLFNLEIINVLNSILKNLNRTNGQMMIKYDSEIGALEESINSISQSIEKSLEKERESVTVEIEDIKIEMLSKKEEFETLKVKKLKVKEKDEELKIKYDKEKDSLSSVKNEISNAKTDIDLYNMGKCPRCKSDLHTEHFLNLKDSLIEKESKLQILKSEIEKNIISIKEKQLKLNEISDKIIKSFNDVTYLLKNKKTQLDQLLVTKNTKGQDNINIQEFRKTLEELGTKKQVSQETSSMHKDRESYYKELSKIFGEEGVKKSIISGIIKPINYFISENVRHMKLNFDIQLDDTFTATIKQFGNPIETETLSDGEHKKCNICILFAYLKLIRTRRNINILFLDEVFTGIDVNGIDSILELLRNFAQEYKINIFVIHHAIVNQEHFDRILKVEKNIFTTIDEISNVEVVEEKQITA